MARSFKADRYKLRKNLSVKFNSYLLLFIKDHNDLQVRELINKTISPPVSEAAFSKMKSAHQNRDYLKDIHEKSFTKVLEALDKIILEKYKDAIDRIYS